MNDRLIRFQIMLSTAEEEESLFQQQPLEETAVEQVPREAPIPGGVYRVVDGELYRLVPGIPPAE